MSVSAQQFSQKSAGDCLRCAAQLDWLVSCIDGSANGRFSGNHRTHTSAGMCRSREAAAISVPSCLRQQARPSQPSQHAKTGQDAKSLQAGGSTHGSMGPPPPIPAASSSQASGHLKCIKPIAYSTAFGPWRP